jgi:hypothetical protein
MRCPLKLLLFLAAATAVFLVQPVKANRVAQTGPNVVAPVSNVVSVPDGGSTVSLVGFASLGLAAWRRFLMG